MGTTDPPHGPPKTAAAKHIWTQRAAPTPSEVVQHQRALLLQFNRTQRDFNQPLLRLQAPPFVQHGAHRIRFDEVGPVPSMQATYTRKVSNSSYAPSHQGLTKSKRLEPLSNIRTNVRITQCDIRLMIITHAALQIRLQINALLESFD